MAFLWRSISDIVSIGLPSNFIWRVFHWALPLILAIGTTPGVFLRERVNRMRYLLRRKQTSDERRFATYHEMLSGRKAAAEIRLFDFGTWLIERADALWKKLSRERINLARKEVRLGLLSDGLNAVTYIAAIAFSLGLLLAGQATIGAYAAFFYAIEHLQRHYRNLIWKHIDYL